MKKMFKVKNHKEFIEKLKEEEKKCFNLVSNATYEDNESPYSREYAEEGMEIKINIKTEGKGNSRYQTWSWTCGKQLIN